MTENEEIDREREWLLRQRDNGLVHDQIVALIRVAVAVAVTKNLNRHRYEWRQLGDAAAQERSAAYLDRQEREAAERRQAAIDEEAERRRAGASFATPAGKGTDTEGKACCGQARLIDALKASLKNLEATILQSPAGLSMSGLKRLAVDTGGRIHGDGVIYARTLEGFRYADSGAEQRRLRAALAQIPMRLGQARELRARA